mmetsp:Transcript_80446/g.236646  ORF Transcript_80446/g.236646 Transcript_80446/m.236646 type:complete len:231 (-) Transcript_80446:429-1121(-)
MRLPRPVNQGPWRQGRSASRPGMSSLSLATASSRRAGAKCRTASAAGGTGCWQGHWRSLMSVGALGRTSGVAWFQRWASCSSTWRALLSGTLPQLGQHARLQGTRAPQQGQERAPSMRTAHSSKKRPCPALRTKRMWTEPPCWLSQRPLGQAWLSTTCRGCSPLPPSGRSSGRAGWIRLFRINHCWHPLSNWSRSVWRSISGLATRRKLLQRGKLQRHRLPPARRQQRSG